MHLYLSLCKQRTWVCLFCVVFCASGNDGGGIKISVGPKHLNTENRSLPPSRLPSRYRIVFLNLCRMNCGCSITNTARSSVRLGTTHMCNRISLHVQTRRRSCLLPSRPVSEANEKCEAKPSFVLTMVNRPHHGLSFSKNGKRTFSALFPTCSGLG